MSFILDALRKSEHERQRSATPGLTQVPIATPQAQLPRWAVVVIGALGAGVLVLGGAWWQSTRTARAPVEPAARVMERNIELPAPAAVVAPAPALRPTPRLEAPAPSLATAARSAENREPPAPEAAAPAVSAPARLELPADGAALPSAAALAAEGVALPTLRLELHAFSREARDRFVFINGRKYVEGDRLAEGPQLVTIAPTGAVLVHGGRRFMLVQE